MNNEIILAEMRSFLKHFFLILLLITEIPGAYAEHGPPTRALLLAQCAYSGLEPLEGPAHDAERMLAWLAGTKCEVIMRQDLKAVMLLDAVREAFTGVKADDVLLLYYSGHCDGKAFYGVDGGYVTGQELKSVLDALPGTKLIIMDACGSGALLDVLSGERYYLALSSQSTQASVEREIGGAKHGLFTWFLTMGCGADDPDAETFPADFDGDGMITLEEACRFAQIKASGANPDQCSVVWPAVCDDIILEEYGNP